MYVYLSISSNMSEKVDFWVGATALLIACMPWWITLMPLLLTFSDDIFKNQVLLKSRCFMYVICYTLCRCLQHACAYMARNISEVGQVAIGVGGMALCVFHVSEFLFSAYLSPNQISLRAFRFFLRISHLSITVFAVLEVVVRGWLPWELESLQRILLFIGLGFIVLGECWMLKARADAGSSFQPGEEEELVETGAYRLCRHPWYFGWMLWTLGLWTLVACPVTALSSFVVNCVLLTRKIEGEELRLKQNYENYRMYSVAVRRFPRGFNWMLGSDSL